MNGHWKHILIKLSVALTVCIGLYGCQSVESKPDSSLYFALGEREGIQKIVDVFIFEIGENEEIIHHFEDTDIDRFREKQIEHVCVLTGGPCEYTGDDMIETHRGMNITEAEFNSLTNSLIKALDTVGVSVSDRNRLISIIAPMRGEVIYQ